MTKRIIVAAALGYSEAQVRPFLATLRFSGYTGEIVFFVNESSSLGYQFTEEFGLQLLRTRVSANADIGQIVSIRYFLLQEFLRTRSDFDQVFFTDVRDVIFQRDPFDFPGWDRYKLFYALEERVIGDCGMNSRWLNTRYGQGVLHNLIGEVISCCGTIFGYRDQLAEYTNKMCDHLRGAPAIYGMDTGAHNYIIRREPILGQKALLNGLDSIMTVHYMNHNCILSTPDGMFANYNGTIPNVVHQYDRIPAETTRKFGYLIRMSKTSR